MEFNFLNFITMLQKPMIMMLKFIIGAVLLSVATDIVYALYTKIYRMRRSIFAKYKNLKEYISSMQTVSVLCGISMDENTELELLNKNISILKDVTYLNELLDSKWYLRYIYKGKKHLSEDDFVCELSKENITKYKPLLIDKLLKSSHEGNIDNLKREIDIINKIESLKASEDFMNAFSYKENDKVCSNLLELLEEPQYKPFSSVEKAMKAIKKHGGWVEHKETDSLSLTIGLNFAGVFLGNGYNYSFKELFHEFTFADDGTPCGELVEE